MVTNLVIKKLYFAFFTHFFHMKKKNMHAHTDIAVLRCVYNYQNFRHFRHSQTDELLDICRTSVLKYVSAVGESFNLKDTIYSISVMVNEVCVQLCHS